MFLVVVALSVWAVVERGGPALGLIGALLVAFLTLVVWHERVVRAAARARGSVAYYERGLARLDGTWVDQGGDDGQRFSDPNHLFAADLELFGRGSLFHLISTARTETGAATLADWLKVPAAPTTIASRQGAVRELAPNVGLRHDLGTLGGATSSAIDSATLRNWALAVPAPLPAWARLAFLVAALANLTALGIALLGWVPGVVPAGVLALAAGLALWHRGAIKPILEAADRPARELKLVGVLLARCGSEQWSSPLLANLRSSWTQGGESPELAIRRLERLIDLADARRNQLFLPIAGLLLLGSQLGAALEAWRRSHGERLVGWIEALGQLEALASLATRAFESPDDAYPSVTEQTGSFAATGLAHPLLAPATAVRNDVVLGGELRLLMVSGSNMSGKSTLLKAIGSNLVLAHAGGTVRAHRLNAGTFAIGASLVLRDSLLEGRSRFFAEVLRLKAIADCARSGRPTLFLLDELLSGTNSHDRAIGARGVLEGLVDRGAIGVVTTHDLALTQIATDLAPRGANWHFEDELRDGKLSFDYTLKPGVVERSNALELMRMVGL